MSAVARRSSSSSAARRSGRRRSAPKTGATKPSPTTAPKRRRAPRGHAKHRDRLFRESDGSCVYCGTALTMVSLTLDHIYPQQCGGPDEPLNLASCCASCNNEKANLKPDDWFRQRPTAAGAFLLLAGHCDASWRRLAAEICETPYRDDLWLRLPRALRTAKHLQQLESAIRAILPA